MKEGVQNTDNYEINVSLLHKNIEKLNYNYLTN
jgi:hypothetical protein